MAARLGTGDQCSEPIAVNLVSADEFLCYGDHGPASTRPGPGVGSPSLFSISAIGYDPRRSIKILSGRSTYEILILLEHLSSRPAMAVAATAS